MASQDRERAAEFLQASFDQQDTDTDGAGDMDELQFIVAYHQGYRAALRELFPDIEDTHGGTVPE